MVSIAEWKQFLRGSTAATGPAAPLVRAEKPIDQTAGTAVFREGTIIGRSVLIHGELYSREGVHVYGELEGTVDVGDCAIVIEQGGTVAATVKAGSVVIHGVLRAGNIISNRITVCRDGSLIGDGTASSLVVEEGAYLHGRLETST